jgi:hypothetical protein
MHITPVHRVDSACSIDTLRLDIDDFMSRRLRSTVFDSCWPHASNTNLFAYNDQAFGGSTTTLPLTIRAIVSV